MDDKKYAQIIKNYSRFFVFVFKYLIVLIALVVVVLLFKNYFLNPAYQWEHSDPYFIQKTKLVGSFEKFLKQTVQDNTIQIYILQGKLTTQDNFILSQDNLISYKGFIVPQYFSIATTLPVKQISYFDSPSYATGELEQVVNNLVLTKKFTVDQDQNQTTQIPITN